MSFNLNVGTVMVYESGGRKVISLILKSGIHVNQMFILSSDYGDIPLWNKGTIREVPNTFFQHWNTLIDYNRNKSNAI
jgi:hypothetical protein